MKARRNRSRPGTHWSTVLLATLLTSLVVYLTLATDPVTAMVSDGLQQHEGTPPHPPAMTAAVSPEQQVDYRVQKRWEIADTLRRQAESAWQAGEYRAAVTYSRQSWAVMPGFPPLDAAREKRWEIADRLQREGNAARQAGEVRHAASLYRQSQAVLPW